MCDYSDLEVFSEGNFCKKKKKQMLKLLSHPGKMFEVALINLPVDLLCDGNGLMS